MSQIFGVVSDLKQHIQAGKEKVYIEDWPFRLFSKVTVTCLFAFSGLITLNALIGENIECIVPPKEDVRQKALNQYCFIMGTYTLPHLYNQTVGIDVAAHGVGPHDPETDEQKRHTYYQWVPFFLFFQGLLFLLPHAIWKVLENGTIKSYCGLKIDDDNNMKSKILDPDDGDKKDKVVSRAAEYFERNERTGSHRAYAYAYVACEILNFVIVLINIFATDGFLGNEFSIYGHEVFQFMNKEPEERMDPMNRVFPKVSKCDFQKYGPSGNLIRYDIMCVLALNIINEKIYVFLWFWFIILAIIGGLSLVHRAIFIFSGKLRKMKLLKQMQKLRQGPPESHAYERQVENYLTNLRYYDWFVLERISVNIHSLRLQELVRDIIELPKIDMRRAEVEEEDDDDEELRKPMMKSASKDDISQTGSLSSTPQIPSPPPDYSKASNPNLFG